MCLPVPHLSLTTGRCYIGDCGFTGATAARTAVTSGLATAPQPQLVPGTHTIRGFRPPDPFRTIQVPMVPALGVKPRNGGTRCKRASTHHPAGRVRSAPRHAPGLPCPVSGHAPQCLGQRTVAEAGEELKDLKNSLFTCPVWVEVSREMIPENRDWGA